MTVHAIGSISLVSLWLALFKCLSITSWCKMRAHGIFCTKVGGVSTDSPRTVLWITLETLSTRTGAHDGDGKSVRSLGRDRRRVPLAEHVKQ